MSGNNTMTTLLMAAAVVGTGGAALGAAGFIAASTAGTLAAVGAAGTAGLQIMSGMQASAAAKFEKAQMQQQIRREKIAQAERAVTRERELGDILSAQNALFGTRGVELGSGSSLVISQESASQANREARTDELNTQFRISGLELSAQQKAMESRAAIASGVMGATQSLMTFGAGGQATAQKPKTGGAG